MTAWCVHKRKCGGPLTATKKSLLRHIQLIGPSVDIWNYKIMGVSCSWQYALESTHFTYVPSRDRFSPRTSSATPPPYPTCARNSSIPNTILPRNHHEGIRGTNQEGGRDNNIDVPYHNFWCQQHSSPIDIPRPILTKSVHISIITHIFYHKGLSNV